MKTQLEAMLELQNAMNTRIHDDWRSQAFEWYRAIWVECAELMDHYGWKWWKYQAPDAEQVKLELIDIWHFGLSILLQDQVETSCLLRELQDALRTDRGGDFRQRLEKFTEHTLVEKSFSVALFVALLQSVDMSFDDLYTGYVGKNVLNFFRQDHGYQSGSYQKVWAGKEDNEHLIELVKQLDPLDPQFSDKLYQCLKNKYTEAVLLKGKHAKIHENFHLIGMKLRRKSL